VIANLNFECVDKGESLHIPRYEQLSRDAPSFPRRLVLEFQHQWANVPSKPECWEPSADPLVFECNYFSSVLLTAAESAASPGKFHRKPAEVLLNFSDARA